MQPNLEHPKKTQMQFPLEHPKRTQFPLDRPKKTQMQIPPLLFGFALPAASVLLKNKVLQIFQTDTQFHEMVNIYMATPKLGMNKGLEGKTRVQKQGN
jgi:hypothetical protein